MEKVTVFVLGYRAMSYLQSGSIDSIIEAAKRMEDVQANVVFLDNYSRDGSVKYLLERHKNIDILMSTHNYMYCKGVNVGVQYAYRRYHPDYFIIADADNPCEPDAYNQLLKFARANPGIGLVQPQVRGIEDKERLYSCGHMYIDDVFCRPNRELPADHSVLLDLPSCSFSSTLIRTEVFEKCGLLDTTFEIYYESSDFSFRARRAGYRCACNIDAITYNDGTKVSNVDNFHEGFYRNRNGLLFWKKHDEVKFSLIKGLQKVRLDELNAKHASREYVDDIIEESERRGIEDGLSLSEKIDFRNLSHESIGGFKKTDTIMLQSHAGPL